MKYSSRLLIGLAIVFLAASAVCGATQAPKNIIFIIGDGMGIGAVTGTRCAEPGEEGELVLDRMPVTGLAKTHSANSLVTDSAASGTALATGYKTNNGCISVDPEGKVLQTIAELATAEGKSTGVVTTDAVTGATPAVFYAHVDSRSKQNEIASQLVNSPVSVAMGAGKRYFVPRSDENQDGREDGQDLVQLAGQKGFEVVYDDQSLASSKSQKLIGLFAFAGAGPSLEAMLSKAVTILSSDKDGFFIMAESSLPDAGGHRNDASLVVKGVVELDSALRWALDFAKKDGNTLVVVTSDHDTGGLAVQNRNDENPRFTPGWVTGSHTGNMVAVYAFGPGADRFTGTQNNTQIPRKFAELWGKTLGN